MNMSFWLFVIKELKSLARDPKMLIAMVVVPLVLMAIVYGVLGQAVVEQIKQFTKAGYSISVIDMDRGVYAQKFVEYLRSLGVDVNLVEKDVEDKVGIDIQNISTKILFIIPRGFSENISKTIPAHIVTYVKIESLTIGEGGILDVARTYVSQFNSALLKSIARERNIPEQLLSGIVFSDIVGLLKEKIIKNPSIFFSIVTMGSVFIPMIVLLLVVFAAQLVATSIAIEKEEKMFETLLSLPINRMSVIGAKLFTSILISSIYMLGYSLILFQLFLNQILRTTVLTPAEQMVGLDTLTSFTMPREFTVYLVVNVVGLAIFIVSLSLLLSLFAEDVRTAQAIVGNIVGPTIIVIYLPMFIEASTAETRLAIALIPIANTAFLSKFILLEDYTTSIVAAVSNIVYGLIVFVVLRKIVNSETIFTLKLFRRKRAE
jgi:ABC-2 type transport system permease protein